MKNIQIFMKSSRKTISSPQRVDRFQNRISVQSRINQLEKMKRKLLLKGAAQKGVRLEVCKASSSKHFMQAYWRSPKPIFISRRDGGLVKRRHLGRVGREAHRQAQLQYRRRLSVNVIDRQIAELEKTVRH